MPVMAPSGEDRSVPLLAFNFHVSFNLPAFAKVDKPLLGGFSDVTGLEASMEARTRPQRLGVYSMAPFFQARSEPRSLSRYVSRYAMAGRMKPSADAAPYPSANPHACSVATAAMSAPPAEAMAAEEEPMTLEHTSATVATAKGGQNGVTFFTASGNHRFSANPPSMGSSTT